MRDDAPETQQDDAQRTRKRITHIILGVPGFVLLWMALHGVVADYRDINEQQRRHAARTAEAVAKVVEVHEGLLSLRTHESGPKGTIEFTTASGQTVSYPVFLSSDDKVGTTHQTCYDPRNPSYHASCTSFYEGYGRLWGNAPPFVFGLYFLWLSWRLGRARFQNSA